MATTTNLKAAGGFYFKDGMDSGTLPIALGDGYVASAMNITHRGGIMQTRGGFNTIFGFPCGQPQGCKYFQPTGGPPCIVVAINGLVYYSTWNNGFLTYQRLPNVQFSDRVQYVYWAVCTQFTTRNEFGEFVYLDTPIQVLMMQDGVSRAAYWDGSNSGHLNPTPSLKSSPLSPAGMDGTPQGEWMAWEGSRLWVSRGNLLFASDFGNPLKFKESQYIAEGRAFYVQGGTITGMIQPSPSTPMLVFTRNSITLIRTDLRDRTQWLDAEDMQQEYYTNAGCIAGRSIVSVNGLVWWYSPHGVTNYNVAMQEKIDSRTLYLDNQMACSKTYLATNLYNICAANYENYLLFSVPSSDRWNRHTWCYDLMATPYSNPGWSSYWEFARPVEWTTGNIEGTNRIWCLSADADGVNRLYGGFDGSRTDNGCPVTAWVQTRSHSDGTLNMKQFDHFDCEMQEVLGDFDIAGFFASERGAYQRVLETRIIATPGMYGTVPIIDGDLPQQSYRPQVRYLRSQNNDNKSSDCNSCGAEGNLANYIGQEMSLLFVWSGRGALKWYRIFFLPDQNNELWGTCEEDETGYHVLTDAGCSTKENYTPDSPFEEYTAEATEEVECPDGPQCGTATGVATRSSVVSQLAAQARADCAAFQAAISILDCECSPETIISESDEPLITEDSEDIITE